MGKKRRERNEYEGKSEILTPHASARIVGSCASPNSDPRTLDQWNRVHCTHSLLRPFFFLLYIDMGTFGP